MLLGGYSLAGARKFAFAGSCHQETDYALPKGDQVFAISTYRKVWPPSTLGRSVCGYMEAAPFAVLGLFEIINSRPMLLPLNPSCSEALSASLGKRIPRDTWDSFPGRRNRGDQNARDTFDSFPGKMHRAN